MSADTPQIAIVYARVSSLKQVKEGDGLSSQSARCREFAKQRGYEITEEFRDKGVSGSVANRPAMKEMISYLRRHRAFSPVVLIDDISRLARGIEAHTLLRAKIADAGGRLESPSIEFGDDSDSKLIENLLASVSQHGRQKNAEQAKHRMWARMMNGYAVFAAPIGYRYKRVNGHGKMLVRVEPEASIIADVFEGFASGRFETRAEIKRYLDAHDLFPKSVSNNVCYQKITDMLNRIIYAGYICHPPWDVPLRQGHHEPLVSLETFQAVQRRLKAVAQAPARKDIGQDFPLRGFVTCADCSNPYTASWAKGRNKHYPYYLCMTKGCDSYGKSIKRDVMEGAFEELLQSLTPEPEAVELAQVMLRKLWDERKANQAAQVEEQKQQLLEVERKAEQLLDRIVQVSDTRIIEKYENRLHQLDLTKATISEKITNCGKPLENFDDTFRTALDFLENPQKIWASGRIEDKRMVCRMAFSGKISYARNEGVRTAPIALPIRVLRDIGGGKKEMVGDTGIEPVTPSMSTKCSPAELIARCLERRVGFIVSGVLLQGDQIGDQMGDRIAGRKCAAAP